MKHATFVPARVEVFTSELWQTTSTLVRLNDGLALFDPAYFPSEIDAIRAHADALPGRERRLIFTHSDWDHVVGFPRFRDWTTLAHANVASKDDASRAKILTEITGFDGKWYVDRPDPAEYPRIDQPIVGPTTTDLAGEPVAFLPVPGHTNDMLATFFPDRSLVVAGDLLSDFEFPFVYHSVAAYRRTLDVVRDHVERYRPTLLVPGHGPPATSTADILARLDRDTDYLDTLAARVEAALQHGDFGEALQRSLASMTYRSVLLNPHILDFHRTNVTLAEREALQRLTP